MGKNTEVDTPYFTKEQYLYLSKTFRRCTITPKTDTNTIMYESGRQAVLDKVKSLVPVPVDED